jgi:hypothetical protein
MAGFMDRVSSALGLGQAQARKQAALERYEAEKARQAAADAAWAQSSAGQAFAAQQQAQARAEAAQQPAQPAQQPAQPAQPAAAVEAGVGPFSLGGSATEQGARRSLRDAMIQRARASYF